MYCSLGQSGKENDPRVDWLIGANTTEMQVSGAMAMSRIKGPDLTADCHDNEVPFVLIRVEKMKAAKTVPLSCPLVHCILHCNQLCAALSTSKRRWEGTTLRPPVHRPRPCGSAATCESFWLFSSSFVPRSRATAWDVI